MTTTAFCFTSARRCPYARELNPLFSNSSARSVRILKITLLTNQFAFYDLPTFPDNYRGWGVPMISAAALPSRVNPCSSEVSFSPPATRVISESYKRARKSLKTSTFKSLHSQSLAHSLSLFFCKSFICNHVSKTTGGVYPKTVRFWDSGAGCTCSPQEESRPARLPHPSLEFVRRGDLQTPRRERNRRFSAACEGKESYDEFGENNIGRHPARTGRRPNHREISAGRTYSQAKPNIPARNYFRIERN